MWAELGLLLALIACCWVAVDTFLHPGSARRWLPLGCLALCAILWSGGELGVRLASTGGERAVARQILFLGVCGFPPAWLWLGLRAARPAWWSRRPRAVAWVAAPSAALYATLWLGDSGALVSLQSVAPTPGPLYPLHVALSWTLLAAGTAFLVQGTLRQRQASWGRLALFAAAVAVPLGANVAYNIGRHVLGFDWSDPTAALLGAGVLVFRASLVRSGVTLTLPMSRRQILDQLELGLLTVDLDHRVVDANEAAHRLLGIEHLRDRELPPLLERATRADERPLEIRHFPLRGPLGIVGRSVVIADRSREARTERQLRLAARLEAVGSLTAGIAHEVNNPLAYVRSNLTQLEKWVVELTRSGRDARLPDAWTRGAHDAAELVAEMRDGIERISALVDRLRRFARHDPPAEPRDLDLSDAITRAARLASAGLPAEAIALDLAPVPPVRALEQEIVQVVLNLLVNALHASGERQRVEVRLDAWEGGARVRVLDRGTGIAPDLLPHIFDPFFTTKAPGSGTGLGLSVSYDLVRRHGGRLEADNRVGGGAVFTLWLPLARQELAAETPGEDPGRR